MKRILAFALTITFIFVLDGYVLVFCKGAGIAPSSQNYEFYYSEENSSVTVDCNLGIVCYAADLSSEGDGYQCIAATLFYRTHKGQYSSFIS